ncbi:MAG TPA: PEGA domain-containing protein [Vicinamibacterales bacterium]
MHASAKVSLSALLTLALAVPAMAQDSRRPTTGGSTTGSATSRGGSSSGGSAAGSSSTSGGSTMSGVPSRGPAVSRPSREPQSSARRPSSQASPGGGAAIPAYSRPRGDRAVRGQAVARGDNPLPSRGGDYYYSPYYGYNGYGYYGYGYNYPYRFGYYPVYTGFGYMYYDPFWGSGYYGYGASGGRYSSKDDRDYDIGSLRLKVDPSHAEVYVDGLYRGIVDDFDGVFQRLKLEAGAHRLEIRAAGFQTLVFDVLVTPGETTTYRGDLQR